MQLLAIAVFDACADKRSSLINHSYQDQYWRESTFKGIELVRKALDEAYGAGQVSLVSASFRWLNHHSMMKPECNGELSSL